MNEETQKALTTQERRAASKKMWRQRNVIKERERDRQRKIAARAAKEAAGVVMRPSNYAPRKFFDDTGTSPNIMHVFQAYLQMLDFDVIPYALEWSSNNNLCLGIATQNSTAALKTIADNLTNGHELCPDYSKHYLGRDMFVELKRCSSRHDFNKTTNILYFPWVAFNARISGKNNTTL